MMLEIARKHIEEPAPTLPRGLDDGLVGRVYRRAAAKKPEERYASAAEMAWCLRAAIDPAMAATAPPVFKPPPPLRPRGFWSRLFGR